MDIIIDKTKWGIAIGFGILSTIAINILAFLFAVVINKEMVGTIVAQCVVTGLTLLSGIILTSMFNKKTLGWAFIIGAIVNITIWTYIMWLLSTHGW